MKALTVRTGFHATCLITLAAWLFAGCATVPDEGGAEVVPGPLSPQHAIVYGQVSIIGQQDFPGLRAKAVFVQKHGDSEIEHECWCDADGTFAKVNLPTDDMYYLTRVHLFQGQTEIRTAKAGATVRINIPKRLQYLGRLYLCIDQSGKEYGYHGMENDDVDQYMLKNAKYAAWHDFFHAEREAARARGKEASRSGLIISPWKIERPKS